MARLKYLPESRIVRFRCGDSEIKKLEAIAIAKQQPVSVLLRDLVRALEIPKTA